MSASNWARCPRCSKRMTDKLEALKAELDAAYGKVSITEFDARRAALAEHEAQIPRSSSTFREDYSITGAETGTVQVSYRGGCDVCGLTLSFGIEREIQEWDT